MDIFKFSQENILKFDVESNKDIQKVIHIIFKKTNLPKSKKASILLKPNFNNDLNSLTGNSTDLRLIIAVIKELQKKGYKHIILADGPNCGIDYFNLDVLLRLRAKNLAKKYNITILNLNRTKFFKENLTNKNITKFADICRKVEFFINLPKIKTHTEAILTISSKNLIGCISGLDKRNIHNNFFSNIVRLNEIIKPDLNIVDGIIAMEGDGPGAGTPKRFNWIISGKNTFLTDAVCAKLLNFNFMDIPYLKIAYKKGYIRKEDFKKLNKIKKQGSIKKARKRPLSNLLLKNIFVRPRYWKILDPFFSKGPIPFSLHKLKVKQDIYINDDAKIKNISIDKSKCNLCKKCEICPQNLKPYKLISNECIKCLYCYMICPQNAIKVDGELGFFKSVLNRYLKHFKKLF